MLQACLNGGRRAGEAPTLPLTAEALARDAAAVCAVGAVCLHVHPRDASCQETLAPGPMGAALSEIRGAVPGLPVGVGTGAWIPPGGTARHADMRGWRTLPDYASVNLGEPDALETISLLRGLGVPVEAGLWSVADTQRFLAEVDPEACIRILIEMQDVPPDEALAEADSILGLLTGAQSALPILLHGEGRSAWPCVVRAAKLGLDTRIGFEDCLALPDGSMAADNAALVAAAARIIAQR